LPVAAKRFRPICSSRGNAEKTPSTNLREGFSQPQKNAGAVGKGSKPKAATIAPACPLPTSHYPPTEKYIFIVIYGKSCDLRGFSCHHQSKTSCAAGWYEFVPGVR
jgi:hypothetical protein